MIIIYKFSNQNFRESLSLSGKVVKDIQYMFGLEQIDFELLQVIVRKLAHFSIYLLLGMASYMLLKSFKLKGQKLFWTAFFLCFLYACTDEIHQLFIFGRTGSLVDVLIDSLGSFCGLKLLDIFNKIFSS